jgi:hypothetical protein
MLPGSSRYSSSFCLAIQMPDMTRDDWKEAARLYAKLKTKGHPMEDTDLLQAAFCLQHDILSMIPHLPQTSFGSRQDFSQNLLFENLSGLSLVRWFHGLNPEWYGKGNDVKRPLKEV